MMTEAQKKMADMLGLAETDFQAKQSDKERIAELEAALKALLSERSE